MQYGEFIALSPNKGIYGLHRAAMRGARERIQVNLKNFFIPAEAKHYRLFLPVKRVAQASSKQVFSGRHVTKDLSAYS